LISKPIPRRGDDEEEEYHLRSAKKMMMRSFQSISKEICPIPEV
jgi:hypothetical protein